MFLFNLDENMKKLKIIPWFILLTLLITEFFGNDYYQFYPGAMKIAKKLMVNDHTFSPIASYTIRNKKLVCHVSWLYFVRSDFGQQTINSESIRPLMKCSKLYVHMLSKRYPDNLAMAIYATLHYPEDVMSYHWLIIATDPTLQEIPKVPVKKILSINPRDGLAWHYLGLIYLKEKDLPAAIDANIQSCYNGDPGSNGCYNAGRLLEQDGRYEEAISFYRLSRHDFIRANADRLEEFLAGSD